MLKPKWSEADFIDVPSRAVIIYLKELKRAKEQKVEVSRARLFSRPLVAGLVQRALRLCRPFGAARSV